MNRTDKHNRIIVTGKTIELQDLLKGIIENYPTSPHPYLEKEIGALASIIDWEDYDIGPHHRIYYKRDMIMYIPNCSSPGGQKIHYKAFKTIFDKAYKGDLSDKV